MIMRTPKTLCRESLFKCLPRITLIALIQFSSAEMPSNVVLEP